MGKVFSFLLEYRTMAKERNDTHLGKLIHFILSLKQGLFNEEFTKNTADTPYIDFRTILVGAQQQFGSTIPKRHDQLSQFRRRIPIVPGHAEIGNLDLAAITEKEIGGFQVTMHDPVRVEKFDARDELEE